MQHRQRGLGLWLIGAGGYVGSMTALGLSAMRRGLLPPWGMVSELDVFKNVDLIGFDRIVFGGHEVKKGTGALLESCAVFDRLVHEGVVAKCKPDLLRWQKHLRPGTRLGEPRTSPETISGIHPMKDGSAAEAVERLTDDLRSFRRRHRLRHVVVVNVATTEPHHPGLARLTSWPRLEKQLARPGRSPLPSSSLYALAAIESDCAYVNFTPSAGIDVPALRRRADERGLPYMGRDGKTGETLVKSVLAPLFVMRHLKVLSWIGYNLLGNPDGQALTDPKARDAKQRSKGLAIHRILQDHPTTRVGIDYVPSLGDRKLAWNFIDFQGFLGARMTLEFRWHGVDSLLAAPLILDLARLVELELGRGTSGPLTHLAFFFKEPMQTDEQGLHRQWDRLIEHMKNF